MFQSQPTLFIRRAIFVPQSNYKNFRIASFAAVNSGQILGCSANMRFKAKFNGSGFVYDNSGEIRHSVSVKAVHGKGKLGGFFFRNSGVIEHCGFIAKERKQSDNSYRDEALRFDPDKQIEEIYQQLLLSQTWKNSSLDSLEPDIKANHVTCDAASIIEISSADDLLELIEAVNDGDISAAASHYVLTKNINMGGKKLNPLGDSESTAFKGIFDGAGYKISNFSINAKGRECAGFFGCTNHAKVVNLTVDYILNGTHGNTCGGLVGICNDSHFENCAVYINVNPSLCCGGFVGKNSGTIINCYVCGKISFLFPLWLLLLPLAILAFLLLLFAFLYEPADEPYTPEVIDPNQVPVINTSPVTPPPAGTSRISFELFQEVNISASTQVGELGYVNPARATMDAVIRICISDSALTEAGYDPIAVGARTAEEMAAEDYNPDSAFTELYRSGRVQIGYGINNCKLSPLPNGTTLKEGDYEIRFMIDGY